jgi:hypothetical protein
MTDQQFVINLEGDQRGIVEADEPGWLNDRLRREPGSTRLRLRYDEGDTEGHMAPGKRIRVIAESDDDTEGHAISIHFPSLEEADAFRRRLLVTGVLAGSVALGAVGGIGLANLSNADAAGAGAGQAVTGSAWTQDERPAAAGAASAATGSAWTQDERPAAAGAASAATGSAWTQDERQSDAAGGSLVDDGPEQLGGPQPR